MPTCLGAGFLARTAKHTSTEKYLQVARSAMKYSCSRQLADGSWWYAEEPKFRWIDNFHTGYNLDSLDYYIQATGEEEFARTWSRVWNSSRQTSLSRTAVRSITTRELIRWISSA